MPDPEIPRFWSREAYEALLSQLHALGAADVQLGSQWRSEVRWGRNRIIKSGDWRDVSVNVRHGSIFAHTNQTDSTSQRSIVQWAEHMRRQFDGGTIRPGSYTPRHDRRTFPATHIWSTATYEQTQDTRLDIATRLIASAEAAGMVSAGYLSVGAQGYVSALPDGRVEYVPMTLAECSVTVRDPDGRGSGWAGRSSYAWERIDADTLARTALDKCVRSRDPVRIEPGRYTLIMEPQATFELIEAMFGYPVPRLLYNYLDLS
jgi:predicted Zn-dependent protease